MSGEEPRAEEAGRAFAREMAVKGIPAAQLPGRFQSCVAISLINRGLVVPGTTHGRAEWWLTDAGWAVAEDAHEAEKKTRRART
jgi:hypothetical protein